MIFRHHFFDDLAVIDEDMQVIILENKEPNDEIKAKVNYIEFTKDDNEGRYGFFSKTPLNFFFY
ncbi:hypothetical protein RCO48_32120 [Peribacillus frigoritolerans]|nr:hypothetical protein [Peribacillus frigoritolerans]